ncbi:hypothetical protein OG210_00255 [Streptomyces sp. NBC_00466]|uniref:hypothetical protein n=1 Tax=Streptomyces sp. NBC_00466 TaxID=2903655 RepID=UPI0030E3107B
METSEAARREWEECRSLAESIRAAGDAHVSDAAADRHDRFHTWKISKESGEALTTTLIGLAIHAQLQDQRAATPLAGAPGGLDGVLLRTLAESLNSRPRHELFSGVSQDLADEDRSRIEALRLMTYSIRPTAVLSLERLAQVARTVILQTAEAGTDPARRRLSPYPFGAPNRPENHRTCPRTNSRFHEPPAAHGK